MHPILLIVFLPLLAALVAGLGGPWIGKTAAKVLTTGSLFIGAFLSWPIFLEYIGGSAGPVVVPVMTWIHPGGHEYPEGTSERIANFFREHPRR